MGICGCPKVISLVNGTGYKCIYIWDAILYNSRMKNELSSFLIFILLPLFFFSFPCPAFATPEYSKKTGMTCTHCHINPAGGGDLTEEGKIFLEQLKQLQLYHPLSGTGKAMRVAVGYLHLLSAIAWFGTIMYVHLLLKPAYASKGLPRGELRLAWATMPMVLITGILLTIARVPAWPVFWTTRFGILLGIKIILFIIMFISAVIVTRFIGPRLRKQKNAVAVEGAGVYNEEGLRYFDGKEGRPAYISYKDVIYDVTESNLWKNGVHGMKHCAGEDLTAFLTTAPHDENKITAMPRIGLLVAPDSKRPFHERLFYFFAYMNLVLVFVITFIIALMRWW